MTDATKRPKYVLQKSEIYERLTAIFEIWPHGFKLFSKLGYFDKDTFEELSSKILLNFFENL